MPEPLPYFVPDLVGVGGTLKARPEDFLVHEVPRYPPSGDGEHVMAEIEKVGLSTFDALDLLARRTHTPRRDVGYAGLKDAHAVTRQWVTLRGTTPDALLDVQTEKLKVLYAEKHRNKLRLGHLAGNRFSIKIRDVDPMKVVTLTPAVRMLELRGVPNYFGEQRFGRRGDNDRLGAAFVRGDASAVLTLMLGGPAAADDQAAAARAAFDAGDVAGALAAWPRGDAAERAALVRLQATGDPAKAVAAVPLGVRKLWASALQSRVFNAVVARRIDRLDHLMAGDLAYKHANGACFRVENVAAEQPRATAFEISPTGPMIGAQMMLPTDEALAVEQAAFDAVGMSEDALLRLPPDGPPGERRPLRVRPTEMHVESGIDANGPYITAGFTLPPGAYATTLLRELMRNDGM